MLMDQKGLDVLLEGPPVATLTRLAWPVFVVLALQTAVGIAETYFVSTLGTDAVAGVTLVRRRVNNGTCIHSIHRHSM
jgi:Na+-driven multidrug efflux pump